MFNRKNDKETLKMWQNKCNKLEKENKKLRYQVEAVNKYKEDYEELIASVKVIKARYQTLERNYDIMYNDFKEKINNLLDAAQDASMI